MSENSRIRRVLLASPEQAELYRRGGSKIFIAVERESAIDTILNQSFRPMEEYIAAAQRAISYAGLNEDYGDISESFSNELGLFGGVCLETSSWLKNENDDVFDMIVSVDYQFEPIGEPPVKIMQLGDLDIQGSPQGERPLIMVGNIVDLTVGPEGIEGLTIDHQDGRTTDDENRQTGSNRDESQPGMQGQVKHPETDKRLAEHGGGQHGQGRVTDPSTDQRLAENREPARREPIAARRTQRGRVTSPLDRRLKMNRQGPGAQRRSQNNDDDPTRPGGAAGGSAGGGASGGAGRSGGSASSGGGNKAELATWFDGRPRTIDAFKKDGVTPRKKPGPALGTRYGPRVFTMRKLVA